MADDARQTELRGLLADELAALHGYEPGANLSGTWYPVTAAALLPTVTEWAEREATRRAAEELREAARTADVWTAGRLRDRAAALTPATEEKR